MVRIMDCMFCPFVFGTLCWRVQVCVKLIDGVEEE